jgi:hypothetical protein
MSEPSVTSVTYWSGSYSLHRKKINISPHERTTQTIVFSEWDFNDALEIYNFADNYSFINETDYDDTADIGCVLVVSKGTLDNNTSLQTIEISLCFNETSGWVRERPVRFIEGCGYDHGYKPEATTTLYGFKVIVWKPTVSPTFGYAETHPFYLGVKVGYQNLKNNVKNNKKANMKTN